jgi:hypothetical protein
LRLPSKMWYNLSKLNMCLNSWLRLWAWQKYSCEAETVVCLVLNFTRVPSRKVRWASGRPFLMSGFWISRLRYGIIYVQWARKTKAKYERERESKNRSPIFKSYTLNIFI